MGVTAKSVVFDIADNWGDGSYLAIRQIDFYANDSKIELDESTDFTAYNTSNYSTKPAKWAFDTSTSYTGGASLNAWSSSSGNTTNQRIIIVFDSSQTFDAIVVNNGHATNTAGGNETDRGAKNTKIHYSTDTITDTTYNASISNSTKIFDGQISEHTSSDVQDDETLSLINMPVPVEVDIDAFVSVSTLDLVPIGNVEVSFDALVSASNLLASPGPEIPFDALISEQQIDADVEYIHDPNIVKSVVFDFENNYGSPSNLSVRSIEFYYNDALIELASDDVTVTATSTWSHSYEPEDAFITAASKLDGRVSTQYISGVGQFLNQRLICVFDTPIKFDSIVVNNAHDSGSNTMQGIRDIKIYMTQHVITDTTYGASITGSTLIFDGTIDEHVDLNMVDDQVLTLINMPQTVDITPFIGESLFDISSIVGDAHTTIDPIVSESDFSIFAFGDCQDVTFSALQSTSEMGDLVIQEEVESPALISESSLNLIGNQVVIVPSVVSESTLDGHGGVLFVVESSMVSNSTMDMGDSEIFDTHLGKVRYYMVIEGALDGLEDVTIPMSSFQSRRRSGEQTYLSVVIPTYDYADEITDRPNGDMVVYQGYESDGDIKLVTEIIRTDIETIKVDIGTSSQSVTLTGYKQKTFESQTIPLSNIVYKSINDGKRRFRLAKPYVFLNPGDVVQIDDEEMIVDTMSYAISPSSQQLEIQEA